MAAATPVPDWSVRVLGALARYPARRYLLAFAMGRVPKFWVIATMGQVIHISPRALLAVVLASIVVAYSGVMLRRRQLHEPRPSAPALAGIPGRE